MNPMPGFADLDRGYFSAPLSTWYLPFSHCTDFGNFIVAEIEDTKRETVLAIATHELAGHQARNGTPVKRMIRIVSSKAYEALYDIMATGSDDRWPDLIFWNRFITKLIGETSLVEEAYATLSGFVAMRRLAKEANLSLAKIDRIERKFASIHGKRFGKRFNEIYSDITSVRLLTGDLPITMLSLYAEGIVDYRHMENTPVFSWRNLSNNTAERRFAEGIDIVKLISQVYSQSDLQKFSHNEWNDIFERYIREYEEWNRSIVSLDRWLQHAYQQSLKQWREKIGQYNPLDGSVLAEDSQVRISFPDPGIIETSEKMAGKWSNARKNGRSLVVVNSPENHAGMAFLPLLDDEVGDAIPFADVTIGWDLASLPPLAKRPEDYEWLLQEFGPEKAEYLARRREKEIDLRAKLAVLVHYEGLRVMTANGDGVRCPLRSMQLGAARWALANRDAPPECCGQVKALMRLWEAGKRASEKWGPTFQRWNPPTGCPGCPRASV